MLHLVEIDRYNYLSVLDLSVSPEQKDFVATNQYSLAQAYAQPECVPFALYAENRPVFEVALEDSGQTEKDLRRLLDPAELTKGGIKG